MKTLTRTSLVLLASLWVGLLFCIGFVVAPYLFTLAASASTAVPNSAVAAELIGPLLYSSDVVGLVVGVLLLMGVTFLRRRGEVPMASRAFLCESSIAAAAVCAAINYWVFTPQLHQAQQGLAAKYGGFHLADKADELFQQFTALHQTSTNIFIAGFVAALVALVCMTRFRAVVKPEAEGVAV